MNLNSPLCSSNEAPMSLRADTTKMLKPGYSSLTKIINVLSRTNACILVYKYVDQEGLAAMMVIKRSAGVAPEGNVRKPIPRRHTIKVFTFDLKRRADVTRSPIAKELRGKVKILFSKKLSFKI